MTKRWRSIPCPGVLSGLALRREVWCDEEEYELFKSQNLNSAPRDWFMMTHKSRDDGPLFYYPEQNVYLWFFNNERMSMEEWIRAVSLDLGNGPRRTEEEIAMLVLQYA